MLKSHKQCQALLSFALLSSRRVCPSLFTCSLSTYCLPFVLSNEARKSAWKCVQYEKAMTELDRQEEGEKEREKWWTRQTARMCGGEQRTKEPCRRHSNCYLQPGYSPSPFPLHPGNVEQNHHKKHSRLALWQAKEKQKLTWTCPTDNWLKFGQGWGVQPLPGLHCVEVVEKE